MDCAGDNGSRTTAGRQVPLDRRRTAGIRLALLAAVVGCLAVAPANAAAAAGVQATQRVATLLVAHQAFARPAGGSESLELVQAKRPLTRERTVLPVVGQTTGADGIKWLDVRLPGRPNGHTGWIREPGTDSSRTSWHLVVHLATRRVSVYFRGYLVRTFEAVVGKPSTPTPRGRFFVEESIRLGASDVGAPFALALSARSNVLQEFDGGPGQIALHGLDNVGGTVGTAASHGCVRLADSSIRWLAARVGPGVPVTITS